jgi:hypothetical protein
MTSPSSSRQLALTAAALALLAFASPAPAARAFKPRVGFAMGLIPVRGSQEVAASPSLPVVYHGGSVMRNVRLHTIFWAPAGFRFTGAPTSGTLGYEPLVKQFLTDVAHDSGSTANEFSLLTQYHDGAGPGRYQISYEPVLIAQRRRHVRHRPGGPAGDRPGDRAGRPRRPRAERRLVRLPASGRR